ncbi:YfiR family protein [Anaerophaga thermohalophila]|jgi:hypothetical protein|uniref:YfiR family protein n=1 Tax=Anaerophaga thermohalophila TaxID=177400 RepID=UPI000301F0B0|nr:YfiR family protein [Anaerophaga thermohalophila]
MPKKILIIACSLLLCVQLAAQEENYISLYLFNFTRYVEWPEEKRSGNFVIEVMGHVSVYEKLKEITAGKRVGNQPIEVRNYMSADEVGDPHIMFVGHWQSPQFQEVLKNLKGDSALLITEKEGMIEQGAAINFVIRDGKIQYEVKKDHATARGLNVSSRLAQMGIPVD